jgi:hypothetical protein
MAARLSPETTVPPSGQSDRYDSTIIVIAPIPTAALKGWRRLIQAVSPDKTGAYALDGQSLQPGGCYRAQHGTLIVAVDTYPMGRSIRLLRVHPGGLETVKEWRQKAPLGPRITAYIARRLPAETWRAAPIAGVPNRYPAYCYRCGQGIPRGGGSVITTGGASKVCHTDQCPAAPPKPNERDGPCHRCGKPVPAGAGLLEREWDDLTASPRWTVEHPTPQACDAAPVDLPNRWTDWCPDCGRLVRAGHGVWKDRAARCGMGCRPVPALPSWRIRRRGDEYPTGGVFRAVVAPRPGEATVPDSAPGWHALDEGMVSLIVSVLDARDREDGMRLALVRAATWDEAAPVLADEVELAVDAIPQSRGFKAAFSAERIGDCKPWLAQVTGHDRQFGYQRAFLPPRRDYQDATWSGSRGVTSRWVLSPNAPYEAFWPTSWKKSKRVFLRVTPVGGTEEITRDQVDAMLRHGLTWVDPCAVEEGDV